MPSPPKAKKHPYPSRYRPGAGWATDEAWAILDTLPVGMLPDDYRFITAGMIAGALIRVAEQNRKIVDIKNVRARTKR